MRTYASKRATSFAFSSYFFSASSSTEGAPLPLASLAGGGALAGAPFTSFAPPARISGSLNEPFEVASAPVSISLN